MGRPAGGRSGVVARPQLSRDPLDGQNGDASMDLRSEVIARVRAELGALTPIPGERSIYRCGKARLNVRSASQENGDKY